jgi:saccharopine dehydrogenase-like NADP-dependent oxidoreductase
VVVVGAGAVGARAARHVHGAAGVDRVMVADVDAGRAAAVVGSLGTGAEVVDAAAVESVVSDAGGKVVGVLAQPGHHRALAERFLGAGGSVVSVSDDPDVAASLLALDAEAYERRQVVVVGAGMAPGLSCLLARHAAADLTAVEEIHVAKVGTGGPACARQHHRALRTPMREWRDGAFVVRGSGSGRELCWFPDPIGGLDCYRAALADPLLLHAAFPGVERVTARLAATRRDRVTSWLPMLRPPHVEGRVGAVRVEVRGWRAAVSDTRVLGAIDRPGVAAGCVAAVSALWAVAGDRFARCGAGGLADLVADPVPFLTELAERGVRAAVFEGDAVPGGAVPAR